MRAGTRAGPAAWLTGALLARSGASVKRSLVLIPKEAGEYRTQRASVSYKFEDEEEEEGLAEVVRWGRTGPRGGQQLALTARARDRRACPRTWARWRSAPRASTRA